MYWLFERTIMSSLTVLVILCIKKLSGKKLNPLWHYYIWLILLIQLILPEMPHSKFSISSIVPINKIYSNTIRLAIENIKSSTPIKNDSFFLLIFNNLIIVIWILGALIFLAYFIFNYTRVKRRISKLSQTDEDEVLFTYESIKNKLKINANIPVIQYDGVPIIIGFFKPILLIPKEYSNSELEVVFRHELTHFKYYDTVINCLTLFIRCIYWFNPFIWYSFKIMQGDCELACDYHMIKEMDPKNRKFYASTLLKYVTVDAVSFDKLPSFGIHPMANFEGDIKKRIYYIAHFKKYNMSSTISSILLALFISFACLTKVNIQAMPIELNQNNVNNTYLVNDDNKQNSSNTFNPLDTGSVTQESINCSNEMNICPNCRCQNKCNCSK